MSVERQWYYITMYDNEAFWYLHVRPKFVTIDCTNTRVAPKTYQIIQSCWLHSQHLESIQQASRFLKCCPMSKYRNNCYIQWKVCLLNGEEYGWMFSCSRSCETHFQWIRLYSIPTKLKGLINFLPLLRLPQISLLAWCASIYSRRTVCFSHFHSERKALLVNNNKIPTIIVILLVYQKSVSWVILEVTCLSNQRRQNSFQDHSAQWKLREKAPSITLPAIKNRVTADFGRLFIFPDNRWIRSYSIPTKFKGMIYSYYCWDYCNYPNLLDVPQCGVVEDCLFIPLAQRKEGLFSSNEVSNNHCYIVSLSKVGFLGYFASRMLISPTQTERFPKP